MSNPIYQAIFDVAKVLEIPVVLLALLSLGVVIVEIGALLTEFTTRRRRRPSRDDDDLTRAARAARSALHDMTAVAAGEPTSGQSTPGQSTPGQSTSGRSTSGQAALAALRTVAWSAAMETTYAAFVARTGTPGRDNRIAKDLADFDFGRQRRLNRTRLLVRLGPALGLMGTLIPLSPALDGLAKGDVQALTDNLRVAFSVTVLGLFVGAIAFGISLIRERIYGQDYSDLEYVASVLTDDDPAFDPGPAERST